MLVDSEKNLVKLIRETPINYDAIVVEGYDGVGKGRVLKVLSDYLGVLPYRPDYNLWQLYDHRPQDRWKVSGFFWDVISHFNIRPTTSTMLFDRGVLSGAVYNHDHTIAVNYKKMLRNMKVLHILVTCEEEDYKRFAEARRASYHQDSWKNYEAYTAEYIDCLEVADVDYIIYKNKFNVDLYNEVADTCEGCGHYNHGYCRHPAYNCYVDSRNKRCASYSELETQDMEVNIDGTKVHCV